MKTLFKTVSVIAIVAGISGCNAHNGSFLTNQNGGTLLGGAIGGLAGNQFGKGRGKTAATAFGAVLGAFAGNKVGRSLDNPRVIYRQAPSYGYNNSGYNVVGSARCNQFVNEGVRASCNRGVAERNRKRQRMLEGQAFRLGRGY